MNHETLLQAPAKLTLRLKVTGVRPDGYHTLDAEMITVSLADELHVSEGDGLEIVRHPSAGAGAPIVAGDNNLVRRALALAGRKANVRLEKRIPAGAGLGGGSADAAAILRWAGWRDMHAAGKLGADVPFCMSGGRARVGGIGEVLQPLDFEPVAGAEYTLLTPPFGVSTPAVYKAWDRLHPDAVGRGESVSGGESVGGGEAVNDLEEAALLVEPRLAQWRQRLGDVTGKIPVLAGSGSTWFVTGAHDIPGGVVVRAVKPGAPPTAE